MPFGVFRAARGTEVAQKRLGIPKPDYPMRTIIKKRRERQRKQVVLEFAGAGAAAASNGEQKGKWHALAANKADSTTWGRGWRPSLLLG
jgi:hypothetical protein